MSSLLYVLVSSFGRFPRGRALWTARVGLKLRKVGREAVFFTGQGNYMYFVLLYEVVDDFINRRSPFRAEHLKLVEQAHGRGELVMAGAFSDPVDGAALVFRGKDPAVATQFAEADPYVANGLVTSWRVRGWSVVVGG